MTVLDCVLRLLPWLIAAPVSLTLVWMAARHPRTPEGIDRGFWLKARRRYWKRRKPAAR